MIEMKLVDWRVATLFVQERHYSPVMPKLTKKWLGAYQDDKLVGVLTLGWVQTLWEQSRRCFQS